MPCRAITLEGKHIPVGSPSKRSAKMDGSPRPDLGRTAPPVRRAIEPGRRMRIRRAVPGGTSIRGDIHGARLRRRIGGEQAKDDCKTQAQKRQARCRSANKCGIIGVFTAIQVFHKSFFCVEAHPDSQASSGLWGPQLNCRSNKGQGG